MLIVFLLLLLIRDDGRYSASPLKSWFDQLQSKKGLCCSDADGALVQDADWDTENGHYRVRIDHEWVDVPPDAVITEPNRYGKAMVWGYRGNRDIPDMPKGGWIIRCFMPGSMT